MSNNETTAALSRAYELVEAGKLDEAKAIVDPILAADQNNADAWWIYAHAVTNPEDGRDALEHVLRIDPNYPGAADLMALARQYAAVPTITPLTSPPATVPDAPSNLPETENIPEPELDESRDSTRSTQERAAVRAVPQKRAGLPLMPIVAVIVIVALVLLVLLSQSGGTPAGTPTPTEIAAVIGSATPVSSTAATEQAVSTAITPGVVLAETPMELPTVAPGLVTEQASVEVGAPYAAIQTALSTFPVAANGITEILTSFGNTLEVTVCSTQGRGMRTLLPQVMNAFAKQSLGLDKSVQAIGVHLINCDQNSSLLMVAIDIASAQSYAQGSLSDDQFAALWKPQ